MVAGTAGAVSHHQQQKYAQQEQINSSRYDQLINRVPPMRKPNSSRSLHHPVQYAPPAPVSPELGLTEKLQQLADLHASGVLTDEEFAAAKGKLLASG